MPQGVEVLVEDGYATVEFVDPAKRGPGLNALLQAGGDQVQKVTRPRNGYVVPEDVARAAGLLDIATAYVDEGTGVENQGTEVAIGETAELSGDGSGEQLPEVPAEAYGPDSLPLDEPAEKTWPDGDPEDDWKRPELDAYAKAVKGLDTSDLKTEADVLAAINDDQKS